jgi:hypothetical protein
MHTTRERTEVSRNLDFRSKFVLGHFEKTNPELFRKQSIHSRLQIIFEGLDRGEYA